MKLHKVLTIGGTVYPLVKDDVRLELRTPGRASFTVQAKAPLKGLVTLDIGYNDKPLQRFFIGYVERSTSVNAVEQVLFCRELAAILSQPLPLNLLLRPSNTWRRSSRYPSRLSLRRARLRHQWMLPLLPMSPSLPKPRRPSLRLSNRWPLPSPPSNQ